MFKKQKEAVRRKYNVFMLKASILADKVKKEALKLCFAVVLFEMLLVMGFYFICDYGMMEVLQPKTIIITKEAEAKTIDQKDEWMEELKDYIWLKESGRGQHNYSKCEALGKVNGIGYAIPGDGRYICFNSHEEEMEVLEKWIKDKLDKGMTEEEILKLYTPSWEK